MARSQSNPGPFDDARGKHRARTPENDTGESNPGETIPDADGDKVEHLPIRKIGRYRLISVLGEGGMGSVYLAEDEMLDRKVALKIPKLTGKNPEKVHKRFLREARAAAGLQHRNICQVYDIGEVDGQPYIAMAYLEGKQLSKFVRPDRPIEPRKAATVVRKIALAIHIAHKGGVVHRDLKPANVIIEPTGEPVVMDFGLAAPADSVDSDSRLTKDGAIIGTPTYMPPEQVEGEIVNIGPRSDIYSLGVILYEMLRGRPPFEGTTASVLGQVVVVQPEPLIRHVPELDHELNALCMSMIAKSPKQRPESMQVVAEKLAAYLRQQSPNEAQVVLPPPVEGRTIGKEAKSDLPAKKVGSATKKRQRQQKRSRLVMLSPVIVTGMIFAFSVTILALRTANMGSPPIVSDGDQFSNDIAEAEETVASDAQDQGTAGNAEAIDGSGNEESSNEEHDLSDAESSTDSRIDENSSSDSNPQTENDVPSDETSTGGPGRETETHDLDASESVESSMPDQILIQTIAEADGVTTENSIFCQSLLVTDFERISRSLSEFGYRPTRYRPYISSNGIRTAATWHRLPGHWEIAGPLSKNEIEIEHIRMVARGMSIADTWGLMDGSGDEQFFGIWTNGDISFGPTRATWGQSRSEFAQTKDRFAKEGYAPTMVQAFDMGSDRKAITALFHRSASTILFGHFPNPNALKVQVSEHSEYQFLDIGVASRKNRVSFEGSWLRMNEASPSEFEFAVEPSGIMEKSKALFEKDFTPFGISTWEDLDGDRRSAMTWQMGSPLIEPFAANTVYDFGSLRLESANDWLEAGKNAIDSNEFDKALFAFSKSIDEGGPAAAYIERARLCQRLQLQHAAITDLDNAIAGGAPSEVYVARAEIYAAVGEWELARIDLGVARRKDEDNLAATRAMARLLAIADVPVLDPDKSLDFAKEAYAAEQTPESVLAIILSYAANDQEPRVKQYRRELLESIEGQALEEQLNEELELVLARRFRRGRSLFFNERFNLAAEEFQGIVSICPMHREAWLWLGRAYLEEEKNQLATKSFEKHVELEPNSQSGHHYLGQSLFQDGNHEAAIEAFTLSIEHRSTLSAEFVDDLCWRARALLFRDQPEMAVEDLKIAIRANADHIGANELLARIFATCATDDLRDGERAVELATHVAELTGRDNMTAMDTLACAYAEAGRVSQAFAIMQSMINEEFGPGQPFGFSGPEDMRRRMNRFRSPTPIRENSRAIAQRPLLKE